MKLHHVVVVPDGNRRWAREQGKPAMFGHQEGARAIERILDTALEMQVPCLTIWLCSVGNLTSRSSAEVAFLYELFQIYFEKLSRRPEIEHKRIRVRVLGRWKEFFPPRLIETIESLTEKTAAYDGFSLTFLMAYSGTDEMVAAVQGVVVDVAKQDVTAAITGDMLKAHLWTKDLPPVDLVIRTGGEPHWSAGMLMWDVAESQLYFTETYWPAFSQEEFKKAIEVYDSRERRLGA